MIYVREKSAGNMVVDSTHKKTQNNDRTQAQTQGTGHITRKNATTKLRPPEVSSMAPKESERCGGDGGTRCKIKLK